MNGTKRLRRVKVSADGAGVVSHAGVGLLREMAAETGLVEGISAALVDTYAGVPVHPPGRVFTDLAVAIADGADAISGIAVLADRQELFGPVASMPTTWRVPDLQDPEAGRADLTCRYQGLGPRLRPGALASDSWIITQGSRSSVERNRHYSSCDARPPARKAEAN